MCYVGLIHFPLLFSPNTNNAFVIEKLKSSKLLKRYETVGLGSTDSFSPDKCVRPCYFNFQAAVVGVAGSSNMELLYRVKWELW